ncbi:hypothetical protein B6N60_02109 [Richelia sinica FACHB-800]|uniref:Uncharacterized protein n=1 Tax=Richelia sinica FACHB-800 TaxID=1357546 RepID=A0A975T788_9NOST|nr:hypothetical protein B6N60_02109 [Richelia sinica FACHB-800]
MLEKTNKARQKHDIWLVRLGLLRVNDESSILALEEATLGL